MRLVFVLPLHQTYDQSLVLLALHLESSDILTNADDTNNFVVLPTPRRCVHQDVHTFTILGQDRELVIRSLLPVQGAVKNRADTVAKVGGDAVERSAGRMCEFSRL